MHKGWITAVGASVLMLSLWSGAASAKTHAQVLLHLSGHQVSQNGQVLLKASSIGLRGNVDYSFRIKTAKSGWHTIRRLNPIRVATLKLRNPGTYWVDAVVIPHVALTHQDWHASRVSAPQIVYAGASASLTISAASVAETGHASLTAKSLGVVDPLYRFVKRSGNGPWTALNPFSRRNTLSPTMSVPGSYQLAVQVQTAGGPVVQSAPVALSVYGQAASIKMTPSQKVWVGDGLETEMLTATVVDAEGDPVTNYNGSGTLSDTNPLGAISQWGTSAASLAAVQSGAHLSLTFVNGQASVVLKAGTRVASDTLTASSTVASNQVLTGSTTVATVAQSATGIMLKALSAYLIANESGNPAHFTAVVTDQAGEPMLSGTYPLTATISGAGQFSNLTAGPDTITYMGAQGPVPITVYSMAGSLGPVALNVSYAGLPSVSAPIQAILGGQPYRMGVSATKTTLQDGQSTTLTLTQLTQSGGVSDPASLDNSGYVVSITTANGTSATGFSLNGVAYTGSAMVFSVATGPNFFYAVSQPLTLAVTTAAPGIYEIIVADADGLWKTSMPLSISIQG